MHHYYYWSLLYSTVLSPGAGNQNTLNWAVLHGRIKFTQISDYTVCIYTELTLLCLRFWSTHAKNAPDSFVFFLKCCFTSTETKWTIRDGEPRTSTSTFTQFSRSYTFLLMRIALRGQCRLPVSYYPQNSFANLCVIQATSWSNSEHLCSRRVVQTRTSMTLSHTHE